jgi:hypothetical protein
MYSPGTKVLLDFKETLDIVFAEAYALKQNENKKAPHNNIFV